MGRFSIFLILFFAAAITETALAERTVSGREAGAQGSVDQTSGDNLRKVDTCLITQLRKGQSALIAADECEKSSQAIYTADGYKKRAADLEKLLIKRRQVVGMNCYFSPTCLSGGGWMCPKNLRLPGGVEIPIGCSPDRASCERKCNSDVGRTLN